MRGQRHAPAALYPRGKNLYQLHRRLGGSQGRSGRLRKISPPLAFDPRTVQPVASRYTNNTTQPTMCKVARMKVADNMKFSRKKSMASFFPTFPKSLITLDKKAPHQSLFWTFFYPPSHKVASVQLT
jgi:hypothetical protein